MGDSVHDATSVDDLQPPWNEGKVFRVILPAMSSMFRSPGAVDSSGPERDPSLPSLVFDSDSSVRAVLEGKREPLLRDLGPGIGTEHRVNASDAARSVGDKHVRR